MTYKINGVEFTLQPTAGQWINPEPRGLDGNGHPIYPATREFDIRWGIMGQDEFYEILQFFDAVYITGSAVVDLPRYRSSTYEFFPYSGCVLYEPEISEYFAGNVTVVRLLISNIRV